MGEYQAAIVFLRNELEEYMHIICDDRESEYAKVILERRKHYLTAIDALETALIRGGE